MLKKKKKKKVENVRHFVRLHRGILLKIGVCVWCGRGGGGCFLTATQIKKLVNENGDVFSGELRIMDLSLGELKGAADLQPITLEDAG